MKRAQIEVMGLAVIVVLVALGLFFVIALSLNNDPEQPKQEFTNSQLAKNFLTSFVRSDTPCGSMADLIQDAAVQNNLQCNGVSSKEYVNQTAAYYLEQTLDVWGYTYNFSIPRAGIEIIPGEDCTSDRDKWGTGYQPLSAYPYGDIDIFLDLCS